MKLFDTNSHFGLITILFHWITAITIIGLVALGWYMVQLTYYDTLYNKLPFIHKSIGLLFALLLFLRLIWKRFNPSPTPLITHQQFEIVGAKLAHWSLHLLSIGIVISGYLISSADGSAISVFDWFTVPASITTIPEQADLAGLIHKYMAYVLIGIASLHAIAAIKHHFLDRDDTLKRMFGLT